MKDENQFQPPESIAQFSDWTLAGVMPPEVQMFKTPMGPAIACCDYCKRPWMRDVSECPGCGATIMALTLIEAKNA